ncbi:MAG TPA: diaminobutyrate acetyltransferase [Cellvibrio sp.]|nr:diaminobutyrate acetyltransferase [Cellvibrio sp.]
MENTQRKPDALVLRNPTPSDGSALNLLVAKSPPLDSNSVYCNLLQCTHFAATSVAAVFNGTLVGFVSGYFPPQTPNALFIWQVVVADKFRGDGLAKKMLKWLVSQPICENVTIMCTTITPDNQASWALFESFAKEQGADAVKSLMFDADKHFDGQHEDEYLVTLSPLSQHAEKPMQEHIDDLKGLLKSRPSR